MAKDNIIVTNRQAYRDYFIFETFEAGIELRGNEIKSLRQKRANIKDGFAKIENREIFLYNLHISPYEFARREEINETRPRKLLLRKNQIAYIAAKIKEKGMAAVPLKIYFKKSFAKVEIALAKGKKFYDKREALKAKEANREIDRILKKKRFS
jgi:SsrA-binding protein